MSHTPKKYTYYPKFFPITHTTTAALTLSFLYDLAKETGSHIVPITYRVLVQHLGITQQMARTALFKLAESLFMSLTPTSLTGGQCCSLNMSLLDAWLKEDKDNPSQKGE